MGVRGGHLWGSREALGGVCRRADGRTRRAETLETGGLTTLPTRSRNTLPRTVANPSAERRPRSCRGVGWGPRGAVVRGGCRRTARGVCRSCRHGCRGAHHERPGRDPRVGVEGHDRHLRGLATRTSRARLAGSSNDRHARPRGDVPGRLKRVAAAASSGAARGLRTSSRVPLERRVGGVASGPSSDLRDSYVAPTRRGCERAM
jgi:hypothetical protein